MKKFVLFSFALVAGALSAQEIKVTTTPIGGYHGDLGAEQLLRFILAQWSRCPRTLGKHIGNWGMDDGVGEMTESDDIWEIQFDLQLLITGQLMLDTAEQFLLPTSVWSSETAKTWNPGR